MQPHETNSSNKSSPFILVLLGITALGILTAMVIPHYVRAHTTMSMNSCIFNQMWIETAKRRWATETHPPADAVPTEAELFKYMGQVTPMWATRKLSTRIPAEFPVCVTGQRLRLGTASHPIQCGAIPDHRWDEEAYRFHYALDHR